MKVIIIGAGLSGLSTAIGLRKYIDSPDLEIKVYEKPQFDAGLSSEDKEAQRRSRLGAGLGLQSNGLRVLDALDRDLRHKVYASGFPCDHFKWKTSGDILLGREYVDVLPISRPYLIDCLMERLPSAILEYKTIAKVVMRSNQRPIVQFEDGSPDETADLVVGADGVRSIVRQGLFGDDESSRPKYLGICGVGGVLDIPLPQHLLADPSMTFFTGSTGVFGYSGLTQSDKTKLLYWSVYETELPKQGMKFEHDLLLRQLRERHDGWTDPLIAKCLAKAHLDNIYPIFVMPELPRWGRDGCVLVGDAAHALSPRSGQGSSQAFEDAQTLALLLAKSATAFGSVESVEKAINGYYEVRHKRVYRIRTQAMAWKDPKMPMSLAATYGLYVLLFVLVKVRNLMSLFESVDDWDAKVEVEKYLATG